MEQFISYYTFGSVYFTYSLFDESLIQFFPDKTLATNNAKQTL